MVVLAFAVGLHTRLEAFRRGSWKKADMPMLGNGSFGEVFLVRRSDRSVGRGTAARLASLIIADHRC